VVYLSLIEDYKMQNSLTPDQIAANLRFQDAIDQHLVQIGQVKQISQTTGCAEEEGSKSMRPETAQDQHDEMMAENKLKLVPKAEFEALLQDNGVSPLPPVSSTAFDPIANAMENHPGLTREKAEEMARAFGF
jgi:hypothetical protein